MPSTGALPDIPYACRLQQQQGVLLSRLCTLTRKGHLVLLLTTTHTASTTSPHGSHAASTQCTSHLLLRFLPSCRYIYQYPSLDLCQTLPGGTEQAYSCAVFNADGSMVASVGSAPDYMLTLWEWQTAGTLLRCKAFCQEVYSVKFSPYFSGNLVTCGTGHIRFWKMATTFTGLKLQVGC